MAAITRLALATATALLLTITPPAAQENTGSQQGPAAGAQPSAKGTRQGQGRPGQDTASQAARDRRLPPDSTTQHTIALPDRTLEFTATAGRILLEDSQGTATGEIGYIAYTRPGADPRTRPVTFALNGGPGSASAWLHLGGLGPWRLPMEKGDISPSAVPELVANAETWLDFTDLVFIDPIGTGYSRAIAAPPAAAEGAAAAGAVPPASGGGSGRGSQNRSPFYTVDGDIDSLATFIRHYLRQSGRLLSPKLLVGESYAGFRAPKIAAKLQADGGIGLNALIIVSPVLDFAWLNGTTNPIAYLDTLPSFAAAHREAKGPVTRRDMADVESYATGQFLADLMRGERDTAAVTRLADAVAAFTGLDPSLVRQRAGRIDSFTFMRESKRRDHEIVSIYDSTVGALDPFPASGYSRAEDSFSGALAAPVTSAMLDLYLSRLKWTPGGDYHVLNRQVNEAWDWGRGGRSSHEAVSDLRRALALDPRLDVVVAHGLTDIITPYFRSKLILDQLPVLGDPGRLRLAVYPGGHMFYARPQSRAQFRADVAATVERILKARTAKVP